MRYNLYLEIVIIFCVSFIWLCFCTTVATLICKKQKKKSLWSLDPLLYTKAWRVVSINASGKGSCQVPRVLMETCVSHYHKHIERETEGDGGWAMCGELMQALLISEPTCRTCKRRSSNVEWQSIWALECSVTLWIASQDQNHLLCQHVLHVQSVKTPLAILACCIVWGLCDPVVSLFEHGTMIFPWHFRHSNLVPGMSCF